MYFKAFLGIRRQGSRLPIISRLPIHFRPTQRKVQEFTFTSRRGFWVGSKVQLSPKMQEHHLDRSDVESFTVPGARVFDRYFDLPLAYDSNAQEQKIKVFCRHLVPINKVNEMKRLPFLVYLQGGPGFSCAFPKISGWIKVAFDNGYQVLLLDQRGTGLSSAISPDSLAHLSDQGKADYLKCFRADSIVRDCESIRKLLTWDRSEEHESRISLLGQSFGGFCITTYLSLFPKSVKAAYITGGVPPLVSTPDKVYEKTFARILKRNNVYYGKYPADVQRVQNIIKYLNKNEVKLPNGGFLSSRRFLQLGLAFGGSGGYDTVHEIVLHAAQDLELLGKLSYSTLNSVQAQQGFDTNVIYAILHEAIYCQGKASNWSAERVRMSSQYQEDFDWSGNTRVNFTGETIHPFMFDDYSELVPLKGAADILANYENWGPLYDVETLKSNTVPVAGVSYFDDMYVDLDLSIETANTIKGFQPWITNEFAHNGLREDPERVFGYLIKLAQGDHGTNR
ncbi:Alpha/Beta hydrolase protein [Umbelopsis sp. AD052]|nr:Alpha/Beta hydrolase protein [Umbelopsis sp. AD052]